MNNITGQLIVHEHFIIYIKNYYYRLQLETAPAHRAHATVVIYLCQSHSNSSHLISGHVVVLI